MPHCSLAWRPRSAVSWQNDRRPRQRQHVEVELAGLVLPARSAGPDVDCVLADAVLARSILA